MRGARRGTSVRMRVAVVAIVLADVAVLATDLWLLRGVDATTVVSLDEALVDYRAAVDPIPVTSAPAGGAEVTAPPSSEATTPAAPASVAPVPSTEATVPAAPASFTPPQQGVYRYRTSGGESISVLGARHDYPADTYAVVRHTGGCGWQMRAEVVREHVDEREMCSEPGRLLQLVQAREVEFFGTRDGGRFRCEPPQVQHGSEDVAGSTTAVDCSDGKGSSARLVRTTLGTGRMEVASVEVDVIRLRVDGTMTGRVRGTSTDLLTVVAATGLPVVWDRTVDSVADAFGASVRYQEHARFDLVSLTPAT